MQMQAILQVLKKRVKDQKKEAGGGCCVMQ
jgi:hypothetical protein